jgi:hypothetical protein
MKILQYASILKGIESKNKKWYYNICILKFLYLNDQEWHIKNWAMFRSAISKMLENQILVFC